MDEKLRFETVYCAVLVGLMSRNMDHGWAVNEAHRVATMAVARVNEGVVALTQAEEEEAMKRAADDANGKGSGPAHKGTYQRPAGA